MKTRNYLSSLALMATTALLSACSADSDNTPGTNPNFPQDGVMRFTTSVSDAVQTRIFGYEDSNVTKQDLWLWATPTKNAQEAYTHKGIILHHDESGWGTYSIEYGYGGYESTILLWQDKTTPVEVVAANFGGDVTSRVDLNTEASITVYSTQTFENAITASDWLYFKGTVDPAATKDTEAADGSIQYQLVGGKIRLPMSHINSKLTLKLTLGTEFSGATNDWGLGDNNPLTDVKVNNVYTYCQFDMTTGKFGAFKKSSDEDDTRKSIALSEGTITLGSWSPAANIAGKAVATYECILIPQELIAEEFTITFTLGGKAYKWAPTSAFTLESGKAYTLGLTVGKDLIESQAGDITTKAWVDGTPDNNGNIETE